MLKNLRLRPDALAALDLPVTVRAGLLGSLTLKVCHPAAPGAAFDAAVSNCWKQHVDGPFFAALCFMYTGQPALGVAFRPAPFVPQLCQAFCAQLAYDCAGALEQPGCSPRGGQGGPALPAGLPEERGGAWARGAERGAQLCRAAAIPCTEGGAVAMPAGRPARRQPALPAALSNLACSAHSPRATGPSSALFSAAAPHSRAGWHRTRVPAGQAAACVGTGGGLGAGAGGAAEPGGGGTEGGSWGVAWQRSGWAQASVASVVSGLGDLLST